MPLSFREGNFKKWRRNQCTLAFLSLRHLFFVLILLIQILMICYCFCVSALTDKLENNHVLRCMLQMLLTCLVHVYLSRLFWVVCLWGKRGSVLLIVQCVNAMVSCMGGLHFSVVLFVLTQNNIVMLGIHDM